MFHFKHENCDLLQSFVIHVRRQMVTAMHKYVTNIVMFDIFIDNVSAQTFPVVLSLCLEALITNYW